MVNRRFQSDEKADASLLKEPLHFKTSGRVARNRILKSALTELISTYNPSDIKKSGLPTQRLINLYEKFGNGEYGVLLTGNVPVDPWHLEAPGNFFLAKEGDTEERRNLTKQLAKAAKSDGALALVQLTHAGRQTAAGVNPSPFSASDVQLGVESRGSKYGKPIPLSIEQIKTEVVDRFVFAAKQAKEAGFDGVELHGAHGYLLAQFLSTRTNKRTDQYGGSVRNRARVIEEVYNAIRKEIPASTGFVIGIKINSVEFQHDADNINDVIETAKFLDDLGLDFIELSGGTYENKKREAFFGDFAKTIVPHIKNAVVYLTGGFRTVPAMVQAIKNNETQGVGIGRPVTSEPDLPKKILSGEITGVPYSHYEHDFIVALNISLTQMGHAGLTTFEEAKGNPSHGIPDFSAKEDADKFAAALALWLAAAETEAAKGRAVTGIFEYPEGKCSKEVEKALDGLHLQSEKQKA
ncbi:Oxidored-FMN domain-containing protein [Aphelenchoides bicaudatus]|nr:Oxidored-FMN domain-containing protein [Aphelenchoides bicaudatus]